MLTFDYYKDVYGGTLITQEQFTKALFDATSVYKNYTNKDRLTKRLIDEDKEGAQAIRFALCSIIDNNKRAEDMLLKAQESDLRSASGISSETVEGHSVSFKTGGTSATNTIEQDLYISNVNSMKKYLVRFNLLNRRV